MGRAKYLIDSNAVIDYLGGKLPTEGMQFLNTVVDEIPNISVITKIEVLGFNGPTQATQLLKGFVNDSIVIDLSDEIVDNCIELRKSFKIKLPDAIIASTAIINGLILITHNTVDFKNIKNLKSLDPHLVNR